MNRPYVVIARRVLPAVAIPRLEEETFGDCHTGDIGHRFAMTQDRGRPGRGNMSDFGLSFSFFGAILKKTIRRQQV